MEWIVPVFAAIAGALGLFLSKPERPRVAIATVFFIVIPAIWQAGTIYSDNKRRVELERQASQRLLDANNMFMDALSEMVSAASDGWLPQREEEFLSPHAADEVCHGLNMDRSAPILSPQPWWSYVALRTTQYKDSLSAVRRDYSAVLDTKIIHAVDDMERAPIMTVWPQMLYARQYSVERKIPRAPLLCWGLEPLVAESFARLQRLRSLLQESTAELRLDDRHDWNAVPLQKERIGRDNFSAKALSIWRVQHPEDGPAAFGEHDPNKSPPTSFSNR